MTGGRALELFSGQRQRIAGEVVESDAVAAAVVRLIEKDGQWSGTASELLAKLTPQHPPKGWPASARGMSGHLRRIIPALRAVGIDVTIPQTRTSGGRVIRVEKACEQPSPQSPPSPGTAGTSESGIGIDGQADSVTVGDDGVIDESTLDLVASHGKTSESDDNDGPQPPISTADDRERGDM